MTVSIHTNTFDVNSGYQKIILTFINESDQPVDMNHAAIIFMASGHIDPWGNRGGTLDTNDIIINNSDALLLQPGERGTLSLSLAVTQVPVKMSAITLTLAPSSTEGAASETISDEDSPVIPATDTACRA
ncbi:hydroxymethyltransferase [Salmonella enterica]|nr:hydroxymethyltransferase [Salmonella enterica]ECP3136466.1 hydroxymethyltransferase [Salmonella enterica]EDK0187582.1 hydroxymethyltransferase [Salmonella enterica]EIJ8379370.1 hydroxymethyltransferase [Salmonella enterica]